MRLGYPNKGKKAFSLIELMVAVAIAMILALIIGQMMSSVLKVWTREKGLLRKNMDARSVMDLMVSDLESIVIRQKVMVSNSSANSAEWLHKENDVSQQDGYLSSPSAWLMFLAAPVDKDSSLNGDVNALSYRLGYMDPISSSGSVKMMGLFRAKRTTTDTFANVLGINNFLPYWSGGGIETQGKNDFLIANIVDFQVSFQAINPDGSTVQIPPSATVRLGDTLGDANNNPLPNVDPNAKLQSIDVILTLISEEDAQHLRALSGNPAAQAKIAQQSGQRYVRRLRLNY
jgi:prepilin-type N-terminal cleavage/methylation domain-containing protein